MKTVFRVLGFFGVLALAAGAAWAQASKAESLRIERPWARASIVKTGAVYLTIVNDGRTADRLLGASTSAAERAALHRDTMENGIMRMRPVESLEIEPGKSAILKPGSMHIMLMGLARPLKQGESFPMTLAFEHAGKIKVEIPVQGPTSMGPAAQDKEPNMTGMHPGNAGHGGMGGMGDGSMNGMGGGMQPAPGEKPGN